MFAQRQILRTLRSPVMQRRFASATPKAGETVFAAERRAVKEHAAESTGKFAGGASGLLGELIADELMRAALWKKISILYDITPPPFP